MVEQVLRTLIFRRQVIHACRDNAHSAWNELFGARPFQAVSLHVIHLAVKLSGEPLRQTGLGLIQIDIADARLLKTEFLAPRLYGSS